MVNAIPKTIKHDEALSDKTHKMSLCIYKNRRIEVGVLEYIRVRWEYTSETFAIPQKISGNFVLSSVKPTEEDAHDGLRLELHAEDLDDGKTTYIGNMRIAIANTKALQPNTQYAFTAKYLSRIVKRREKQHVNK